MAFVKTENLTFSYPGCIEKAVNDVSISVEEGQFALIFGPSGSGKSSLIRFLFPGIEPFGEMSGDVYFEGRKLSEVSRREVCERIGYVGQNVEAQIVTDKVWHELAFTLENLGYSEMKIRSRIAEISGYFSISDWLYRDTSSLSGGEMQKLNLAVSMLTFPDLLILDEPLSQLDPVMKDEFLNLIEKIRADFGTTVIICEHDLGRVLSMADICFLMEDGSISFRGAREEMTDHLIDSEYFDYLPQSLRFGYKVLGRKDIFSVSEARKAINGISVSSVKKEDNISIEETAAELKHVFFRYERNGKDVISDLTLKITKGDFVSLVGANGSGKTTLLNLLSGINKPYRGKCRVYGKVAMLPQSPVSLFIKNTVREDLSFSDGDYRKYTDMFSLSHLLDRHPYDLSGGEIELFGIIKVLLSDPEIIILDEPTKGMDSGCRRILGNVLNRLKEEGRTVIISTHDMEFTAQYSDKTSMIFEGDVLEFEKTLEVLGENYYYTTDVGRILKKSETKALLVKEVKADG